jgi:hypothetical protein
MRICSQGEGMSFVSESEVFVVLVPSDDEGTERNISEWHKMW